MIAPTSPGYPTCPKESSRFDNSTSPVEPAQRTGRQRTTAWACPSSGLDGWRTMTSGYAWKGPSVSQSSARSCATPTQKLLSQQASEPAGLLSREAPPAGMRRGLSGYLEEFARCGGRAPCAEHCAAHLRQLTHHRDPLELHLRNPLAKVGPHERDDQQVSMAGRQGGVGVRTLPAARPRCSSR